MRGFTFGDVLRCMSHEVTPEVTSDISKDNKDEIAIVLQFKTFKSRDLRVSAID